MIQTLHMFSGYCYEYDAPQPMSLYVIRAVAAAAFRQQPPGNEQTMITFSAYQSPQYPTLPIYKDHEPWKR